MTRRQRPLEGGDSALLLFAQDLRALREKAGNPPYRELSRRAHFSAASLSDAAGGRKLPTLAVTLAYVRACDGDVREWESRWRELAAAPDPAEGDEPAGPAPYIGLAAFQTEDADRYFGRERLVEELTTALSRRRLVGLFGASGAGKSSLLRAGLVAGIRPAVLFTPGSHPLEECAISLATLTGTTPAALVAAFESDPRGLHLAARQAMAALPDDQDLLIVVDQFEEVFTLCADPAVRARFIELLVTAARSPDSRCRVVLGVRADFYGHCTAHPDLVDALRDAQLAMAPMTSDELRQAIVAPAGRAGCTVESALVSRLIADATGQSGVLPLVSHALLETWHRRRGNALTLAGYDAAGGIDGAVARTAEQAYGALDETHRGLARQLFLRLTAPGEGTEDTKRRIRRDELDTEDERMRLVLEHLAAARLLTLDRTGVEIAHEALIRSWPRLRDWLAEDREGLRVHRQVTEATAAWEQLDEDPGALYRGSRLAVARDWAGRNDGALTPRERRFLDAGAAAEERQAALARRRTNRLRQLVVLLSVLLLVASGSTAYAVTTQRDATRQRNIALSQKVAADAVELRTVDPALAAQLSLAAYRLVPTTQARSSLLSAFTVPFATRIGHDINTSAFTPDGRFLMTGGDDRTIRVWDLTTPHRARIATTLPAQDEDVESLRITPDGKLLVSGAYDGSVGLWDLADEGSPRLLGSFRADADDPLLVAAPSRDGRVLATAGLSGRITLWDIVDPRRPARLSVLTGHTDVVQSLEFAPGGRLLASGSDDGTARLWDVVNPRAVQPVSEFGVQDQKITAVDFSPDGSTLVTASFDHTARLWDVTAPDRPQQLGVLAGHVAPVQNAAFSPDGRTVATAGWDDTVRLWDVADPRSPAPGMVLTGHTNTIYSVVFSPDGHTLASAGADHSMLLTDLPGPILSGLPAALSTAQFSPDRRVVAVGSEDFTARLWEVGGARHPRALGVLDGLDGQVKSVAFSPDGRTVVAAGIDGRVGLWDVTDPPAPIRLEPIVYSARSARAVAFHPRRPLLAVSGDDPEIRFWDLSDPRAPKPAGALPADDISKPAVAFSPDGRTLADARGAQAQLWDVTDPSRPIRLAELDSHTDEVRSVAFSPDGRTLATAGQDRTVKLWDIADPRRPLLLASVVAHAAAVGSVTFSPDGHTLATASLDHSARLWDVTDPRSPALTATLNAHTDRVHSATFSSDGRTLVTTSEDRSARLWDLDPAAVADHVCEWADPAITRDQWATYFPGVAYRPPCP
ncbi:hypothetical protein [Dactylosporangium sp. CA-092794]|uniref:nSTAND1 domain-containing NTPase n=1 Tax=Dactylosporangium sp. CA-092794 TaxID=3239929 RepID=UPI003D922D4A